MAKRYGDLADALDELSLHYRLDDNGKKAHAYQIAASHLRTADFIPPDPANSEGISVRVRDDIAEWRAFGKIEELNEYREQRPYLAELTRIAKIGPKRAKAIHDETGAADIEDIRELVSDERLEQVSGIGPKTATTIRRSIAQMNNE